MGKQIATYNNKVKQLVPGYDLKNYSPGTITVTRNSVENEQYASWSQNEDEQGMYIDGYSIGDGKTGYSSNQLVAMVDLYYRYLSPINGENYEGGERPYQLGDDGCIEIDNISKTIEKGASYEFTLTPKSGFSMVPAGHIEVKDGSNWSSIDISWQNTEGPVNITIPSDKITGNLRFALGDCLYKLYIQKTVDGHNYGDPEEIGIQNCSDTVNVDSLKPAEDPTGTHFVNITKDGTVVSGNQQFCGDTTLNMNYAINQYTIDTSGVNSDCVDIVLSPNVQTIEHGESLTIILTPKEGKRNIGAGSITMGNTAVRTWTSERSITETISSVEGDVVVIASCGEEDTYTVTINWVDGQNTLHTEIDIVQSGASILPEDYVNDWTLPEGYYLNSMSPAEGTTILVNSDKTITYDCRLYEYNINFVAGNGITLNSIPPQYVLYGESLTINDVYEVNQGYRSAAETHTGNAGVSLNNGSVTVTNVKSDVTITIYASQISSYYVSFAFDDPNAGTLDPDRVQVLEDGCAEIEYTLNEYYTLDSIDTEGPGTETHTSNTIEVCDVTGDVTVTINTNYNPPAETHRVTYTLSGNGIQLYKDGAVVPSQTSFDDVEDGNCSEIGYVLTNGYQFDGATSSVQSIVPTVDTTNRTVEVCPTSDVTITLAASQIQHTITYDIYEDGVKTDTQTQSVAEGETATLQYRKSNTEDYLAPTVSSNDPNLTVNVVKNTGRGYTITGTPVTQDATISLYLVTKPTHNVTFEVYLDGDSDPMYSFNITCEEGDMFEDETYGYDTSLYELVEVTSDEIRVSYDDQDGTITMNSLDPITEDTTVEIYLSSIQQKTVTNIYASGMDAMGGVIFQAKFDDGTYDSNQNRFSVSYTDNNNDTSTSKDVVDVFDYSLNKGSLDAEGSKYVQGEKGIYQKSKLNLDYPSGSSRTKQVTVTYQGHSETLNISQRAESYGYYTDGSDVFDASNSSNDLMSATWRTGRLVDYGDSSNMYGGSDLDSRLKGLDGYNKDITPYYMTGTYIGENPLDHLTNNEGGTITGSNKPYGISNYNSNVNAPYNEHFHITWDENGFNKASAKGYIFAGDELTSDAGFCGGYPEDAGCGCDKSGIVTTHTLEALSSGNSGINSQDLDYRYSANYVIPSHNYGRDSISYYHIDNSDYKWNIDQENNPFKDSNEDLIEFSYPLHISSTYTQDDNNIQLSGIREISSFGSGPTSYALSSIRWRLSGAVSSGSTPDDASYSLYEDSDYPAYYDYNNEIDIMEGSSSDAISFDPYNNVIYGGTEASSEVNDHTVGQEYGRNNTGRIIDAYFTLMSPETLIRPRTENGITKFGVLSGIYNGTDYSEYENKMYTVGVSDYISNNGLYGRTRYISQHSWNTQENESREPTDDILIENYPYTILGTNVNYKKYYDSESDEYKELDERVSDDMILEYRWYNLTTDLSFEQYYAKQHEEDRYLHTGSGAKYVDCSPAFSTADYEIYNGYFSGKTWEDIVREGITSIVRDGYYYTITTSQDVYTNCSQSTRYNAFYYKQQVYVGDYFTNATNVYIYYNGCSCQDTCQNCGLGSLTIEVNGVESVEDVTGEGQIFSYQNSNNDDLEIKLYASTTRKDYTATKYTENEEFNVFTGGGNITIVGEWENGDVRRISVNVEGSSSSDDNPGTSGGRFSWDELNQYYYNTTEGSQEIFVNNGSDLDFRIKPTE